MKLYEELKEIAKERPLSLDEIKDLVVHIRATREEKFTLIEEKPLTPTQYRLKMFEWEKREDLTEDEKAELELFKNKYKGKKIPAKLLEELAEKERSFLENKDFEFTLAIYKGKKLTKKRINELLSQEKLTIINKIDLKYNKVEYDTE